MITNILTPTQLFQFNIRYTIPEFQRRYVWEQEGQWEPLWDDLRNTAETYLEELDRSGLNPLVADQNTSAHFLGAVVIQQVPVAVMDIQRREVIDGQQRMTTLQLLLDAIQQVFEEIGLGAEAANLSQFVLNNQNLVQDKDHIFKLWPTTNDREAFRHAMDNGLATDKFENSLIVQAHEFFQGEVRRWLNPSGDIETGIVRLRAQAIQTAVSAKLQMVVIDLTQDDDPHLIFETLNARGTPLEESELVKNYVMSRAEPGDPDKIWGDLSDNWWVTEVRQGRLYRPRIDMLLNYWLAMNKQDDVSPSRIFREFRLLADDQPISKVMLEVKNDLGRYRRFETGNGRTLDEDIFHYRTSVMRIGAFTPALFRILSAPPQQRVNALKALESFLVRRMACRGSTSQYGRLSLELAGRLLEGEAESADEIVVSFLREQTIENREWPNDEYLAGVLQTLPIYRSLTRGRLRLILEGIEGQLRSSPKTDDQSVPRNLTIEHVMPQSWAQNWPVPDDDEKDERTRQRNQLIHTIGNLTLINGRLNASLSNAAWESKRKTLARHSTLLLNHRLLDESECKDWDEDFIQERSRRMAKLVAEVWPGPDSPVWDQ